jgi:hypothetical protein
MTEAEWLACIDPQSMLEFLRNSYHILSPRKLRLFAVACCRSIVYPRTEQQVRDAVDTLEGFAEGSASEFKLLKACQGAKAVWISDWISEFGCDYVSAAVCEATRLAAAHPFGAATHAAKLGSAAADLRAGRGTMAAEVRAQCHWLRDIFLSPFRPKMVKRSWFLWKNATIPRLAQPIYDERIFDRLPVLADALEEAGCTDADILNHCRLPGEHVRGCWVIDLLLGKQ